MNRMFRENDISMDIDINYSLAIISLYEYKRTEFR